MKKINCHKELRVTFVFLLGFVLIQSGCTSQPNGDTSKEVQLIQNVDTQEAYQLLLDNKENEDFLIIDVRTPEEYAETHIESALNIDFYSENFRNELDSLDKTKTYLIYCKSGRRSGMSLDIIDELGFGNVYNLEEGIVSWQAAGLPTT